MKDCFRWALSSTLHLAGVLKVWVQDRPKSNTLLRKNLWTLKCAAAKIVLNTGPRSICRWFLNNVVLIAEFMLHAMTYELHRDRVTWKWFQREMHNFNSALIIIGRFHIAP